MNEELKRLERKEKHLDVLYYLLILQAAVSIFVILVYC